MSTEPNGLMFFQNPVMQRKKKQMAEVTKRPVKDRGVIRGVLFHYVQRKYKWSLTPLVVSHWAVIYSELVEIQRLQNCFTVDVIHNYS